VAKSTHVASTRFRPVDDAPSGEKQIVIKILINSETGNGPGHDISIINCLRRPIKVNMHSMLTLNGNWGTHLKRDSSNGFNAQAIKKT